MTLTEPQAGSNLGVLRAKALLPPAGGPRVRGNKIFISHGITTGKDVELPGPCGIAKLFGIAWTHASAPSANLDKT